MKNLTDFGKALKKNRETKKISLNEISDFTKIDIKYLLAIEEGDFSYLPAVYMRLFLRSYCRYIGEDSKKALNDYEFFTVGIKPKESTDKDGIQDTTKNTNGYYELPDNLERNGMNESINSITLGELNNHVVSITEDLPDFTGTHPGSTNLKDLEDTKKYGRRIMQHAGSIPLATFCLTHPNANFYSAVKYVGKEYLKFKHDFIKQINNVKDGTVRDQVDDIIKKISVNKSEDFAFFHSDMVGFGDNYNKISYTVTDSANKTYGLSEVFMSKDKLRKIFDEPLGYYMGLHQEESLVPSWYLFLERVVLFPRGVSYLFFAVASGICLIYLFQCKQVSPIVKLSILMLIASVTLAFILGQVSFGELQRHTVIVKLMTRLAFFLAILVAIDQLLDQMVYGKRLYRWLT